VVAASAVATLAPAMALASAEHPRLLAGLEHKGVGKEVATLGWGTIQVSNSHLVPPFECAVTFNGEGANETEPGGEANSEKVRAYGKVLGWSSSSFLNTSGQELSAQCRTSSFRVWLTPELPLQLGTEKATIEGQPRIAVRGVTRTQALPWAQEARGEETPNGPSWWLTTGEALPVAGTELVHLSCGTMECRERSAENTEKDETKVEEATVGVPTELRTGCYHHPEDSEIVREPGFVEASETEEQMRPAPRGCVRLDLVAPEIAIEETLQGTLEPRVVNGVRSALTPSKGELLGGCAEACLTERGEAPSSERNERHLENASGPVYVRTLLSLKVIGFLSEELLKLG
jgi:hypothetical protein